MMKKNRFIAAALAFALTVLLGGCGNAVYELTDDEKSAIVSYSSHVVTKFNKKQSEGISDVGALEKMIQQEQEAALEEQKKQEEQQKQEEEKPQTPDAPQTDAQDTKPEDGGAPQQTTQYVSLNQALQLGGIDAVYKKYLITDTYKETDTYMVSAESGNDLLVIQVNLVNNGSKPAECDMLEKMPSFRLKVNGTLSISADTSILLNDLGTYQSTIEPGVAERTVLIFQVQSGTVKDVTSLELDVTTGDKTSTVRLVGE